MPVYDATRDGDPCPMCGTPLHSGLCEACRGRGRSGLLFTHHCKHCSGTGKAIGCPNFFSHPGLGPQQALPI
jgi:hypothetical protein